MDDGIGIRKEKVKILGNEKGLRPTRKVGDEVKSSLTEWERKRSQGASGTFWSRSTGGKGGRLLEKNLAASLRASSKTERGGSQINCAAHRKGLREGERRRVPPC